jgi:hypothetical protein
MEYPPGSGGVVALDGTVTGHTYAFDDVVTCLEGEGSARVIEVQLIETVGEIGIESFSALPANRTGALGHLVDPTQSLRDAGYPLATTAVIEATCPQDVSVAPGPGEGYAVLGIEVVRGAAPATSRGIRVIYESAGEVFSVDYPLGIALCDDLYPGALQGALNPACDVSHIDIE